MAGAYKFYRLAHPGLGTLLRDAAGRAATSRADRCRILGAQPYACVVIALKLQKNGASGEAEALLTAFWRNAEWPLGSVTLAWWAGVHSATLNLKVLNVEELSTRTELWLSQPGATATLNKLALATPLGGLASFLAYARTEMPAVAKVVRDGLAKDPDALVKRALATPLHFLASFLTDARTEMPAVAKVVRDGLAKDPDALVKRALATPLGDLAAFLAYARTEIPAVAKVVRDGLAKDPDALVKRALATPLHFLASFLTDARTEMPAVAKVVRDGLAKDPDALVKRALATPLGDLAAFLAYARTEMPAVAKVVRDGLAKDPDALVKRALATPLHFLASFLTDARTEMPAVAKVVRDGLAKDPDALVERALATPLGDLAAFLADARTEMPAVAKVVRDGLAKDPDALVERALATPLGDLASFLADARTEMPAVAKVVRDGLAKDPDALVKRALATPLDHLASFLACARTEMPEVRATLRDAIVSEGLLPTLAFRFAVAGPREIVTLCREDEIFVKLIALIDLTIWATKWGNTHIGDPTWIRSFAQYCFNNKRSDLLNSISRSIICFGRKKDFPSPNITIRHLTYILTSQHGCSREEVENFLGRCFPHDRLASQFRSKNASVGSLAGSVRSVALDEREWLRRPFCHPDLLQRVCAEEPTSSHSTRHIAEWLQLLCAARLLGCPVPCQRSMGSSRVSEALHVLPPGPSDQGIEAMQAGLWAGVREWCHISGEQPVVDAALAEGILAQFHAARPVGRPRQAALNAVMIEWLERCQRQGWRLVADHDLLLDALELQLRNLDARGRKEEAPPVDAE